MKGSKIWLIIATVLMISGLGLAAVGTANGGSWRFKIKNFKVTTKADNDYVTKTINYDDSEAFKKIIVDSSTIDINIRKGDGYSVTYFVPEDSIPEISNNNGVLDINTTEDNGITFFDFTFMDFDDNNPYITITTPYEDATDFKVKTSTGDITVTDMNFEGEVKSSTGDIKITRGSLGYVDILTSTGDITVDNIKSVSISANTSTGETRLINSSVSEKLYVDTSTGDVELIDDTLGRFEVEGSTSDVKVNNSEIGKVKISVSTGEVELGLKGDEADYSFDLHSSTGDIRIGKDEYEDNLVRERNTDNSVYVHTSTGDIDIDFNK